MAWTRGWEVPSLPSNLQPDSPHGQIGDDRLTFSCLVRYYEAEGQTRLEVEDRSALVAWMEDAVDEAGIIAGCVDGADCVVVGSVVGAAVDAVVAGEVEA